MFKKAFEGKRVQLVKSIQASDVLWKSLHDKNVLTIEQVKQCQAEPNDFLRVLQLLEHLERRPDTQCRSFCDVLKIAGQEDVLTSCLPEWFWSSSRKAHLVSCFKTKGVPYGVTRLADKIYVVCDGSDAIHVFGPSYEQLADIQVERLNEPRDIVACERSHHLYVADWKNNCVWRVTVDGKVEKWIPNERTTTASRPWKLSVTSGRLLVTSRPSELSVYAPEGAELKHVVLPDQMDALHAVETLERCFVVSHIGHDDDEEHDQVSLVNEQGHVMQVFGGHRGNGPQQFNEPRHLAMNANGEVYVADYWNHRVLVLSKDLQRGRILLSKEEDDVVEPYRLHYEDDFRQLIVVEFATHCIKVFSNL